jgi:hypothetical protein
MDPKQMLLILLGEGDSLEEEVEELFLVLYIPLLYL